MGCRHRFASARLNGAVLVHKPDQLAAPPAQSLKISNGENREVYLDFKVATIACGCTTMQPLFASEICIRKTGQINGKRPPRRSAGEPSNGRHGSRSGCATHGLT
jgi:hypothetical protein